MPESSNYYIVRTRQPVTVGTGSGLVKLKITYGYKQIGASSIQRAKDAPIEKGEDFDLGPANALRGKSHIVKSLVMDHAEETNMVNVVFNVTVGKGAAQDIPIPAITVDNDGDPAVFITRLEFI